MVNLNVKNYKLCEVVSKVSLFDEALTVLTRLVNCPDVNRDMLSPETIIAAEKAREFLEKVGNFNFTDAILTRPGENLIDKVRGEREKGGKL